MKINSIKHFLTANKDRKVVNISSVPDGATGGHGHSSGMVQNNVGAASSHGHGHMPPIAGQTVNNIGGGEIMNNGAREGQPGTMRDVQKLQQTCLLPHHCCVLKSWS